MKLKQFRITILDNIGQFMYEEDKYGFDERDILEKVLREVDFTAFTTIKIYKI